MKVWITNVDISSKANIHFRHMAFSTREKVIDRLTHLKPGDISRWDWEDDSEKDVDLEGYEVEVYDAGDEDYIGAGLFYNDYGIADIHCHLVELDG